MSLHQLAQHMQSRGRNGDSMLVHMTPGEVHGLQALAMASGGSLTINPDTGLPEASWLKKLLPAIAGAVLTATGVGAPLGAAILGAGASSAAAGALGAGLITGGLTALATGSLKQGLMAGMGAYGGGSLSNAVAGAAAPTVTQGTQALAEQAAAQSPLVAPATVTQSALPNGVAGAVAENAPFAQFPAGSIQPAATRAAEMSQIAEAGMSPMDKLSRGWDIVSKNPETLKQFGWDNKGSLLAAAAPVLAGDEQQKIPKDKAYIRPYIFDRKMVGDSTDVPFNSTAERRYFDDTWTAQKPYLAPGPEYKARGGIVALAGGGGMTSGELQYKEDGTPNLAAPRTYGKSAGKTAAEAATEKRNQSKYRIPVYSYDPATGGYTLLATDSDDPKSNVTPAAPPPAPTPATAVQIANAYNQVLRRPPNLHEINFARENNTLLPDLKSQLTSSQEYLENLTKPFVPAMSYSPEGIASIQGAGRPYQAPAQQLGLDDFYAYMNQALPQQQAQRVGYADGGMTDGDLGGYSDGGRLLRGPGDGVSDDIPAVIGQRQPARLADGEFVVPARIVSELGNGSTEAGAKKLYAMMDRVQSARRKSVGKGKVAVDSKAHKHLPA